MRAGAAVPREQKGVRMNHLHWMKLYIGDELSNTSHMTPAEIGSYMLLKMHYWRFGCLPIDDERLARIAKVSLEEWNQIKPSIGPLFDEEWRDLKLEAQRSEAEAKHQARVEAGKKGGRPRKDEKQSYKQSFSDQKAKPKQPEPEPEPEPDTYSDLDPESDPDDRAYEKGRKNTREGMFTPFPIPSSEAEGRAFLMSKGVPHQDLAGCLRNLLGGNFSPYDLEGVLSSARGAA